MSASYFTILYEQNPIHIIKSKNGNIIPIKFLAGTMFHHMSFQSPS